ncbi:MAG: hypothetical protein GXO74_12285 [Calditrichaeota bacterium]|nr:hypothetical protein [Calditrichota bacterium]
MKKLKITILFLGLLLFSNNLLGQTSTVTIPDISAPAGKDVNLDIQVSDLTGLEVFSVDFALAFDGNLLQALEVSSAGAISAPWGNPTINISSGNVIVSLAGIDPLSGGGKLVRIKFHVSETASFGDSTELLFLNFKFNDGQPQAITQNGRFTVSGDLNPPTIVSGPTIIEKNYFNVKIHFETDEPSSAVVLYGENIFYGQGVSDTNFTSSHILNLTDLRETTKYYYQIQLTDSLNNGPSVFSGYTFTSREVSLTLPDVTADPGTDVMIPVFIPDFTDLNVQKIKMEILFDQNQLQVFGINISNTVLANRPLPQITIQTNKLILSAEYTTSLQGGGTLFFISGKIPVTAVLSQPSEIRFNNVALNDGQIRLVTNDGSLTVEDRLPPQIVSGPEINDISSNSATIRWQTNEPATSLIQYGLSGSYSYSQQKQTFVTNHEITLYHLNPGVTYHFRVGGKDSSGNGPNWSDDAIFVTSASDVSVGFPDTTVHAGTTMWIPLLTSNIADYSVKTWSALIGYDSKKMKLMDIKQENTLISTWNPIQVDSTAGYISINANGSYAISGAGELILLEFKIKDSNQTNQTAEIALLNFRYDQGWPAVNAYNSTINIIGAADILPPQITWGPYVDKITNSSARIYWRTDELSYAEIEYGATGTYGNTKISSELDTLHQIILTNLQPNFQYHYHVRNRDLADNISLFSADSTFSTLSGNSVAVSIPIRSANAGAVIEIPIHTTNLTGLEVYSCDIDIDYDETKLSAISASSAGCLTSSWGNPVYTIFQGELIVAMGGIQALQNEGDLVKLKFQVSNSARPNDIAIIRFNSFVFNEGTPLSSLNFGTIKVKDNIPPRLLVGPVVMDIQPNSTIIAWQTDEPANSRVLWGIQSADENIILNETVQKYHAVLLDGLAPHTTYSYRIASTDSSGNGWMSDQIYQFTTSSINQLSFSVGRAEADRNQDILIALSQAGSSARPIFSLDFDLIFSGEVLEFKDAVITSAEASAWSKEFQVINNGKIHFHLQGFQPVMHDGELLKFQFLSKSAPFGSTSAIEMRHLFVNGDSSNISITNGIFRLIDRTLPVFVTEPIISQIHAMSAHINWQTDELTTGVIVYNKVGFSPDTIKILTPATETNYTLTGLSPITTYQLKVGITDTSGNGPVWGNLLEFSTTSGNEVEVVLPDTAFAIGDTVLYPILLTTSPTIPINNYEFKLVYNSNFLEFLNTNQTGSLTESWQNPTKIVKRDSLIISHSAGQAILQTGILLKLQFVIKQQAHHEQRLPLRFASFVFNDGVPPASVRNGSIRCLDFSPPKFIDSPTVTEIHPKSVVIKVQTDEPTTLTLNYGQDSTMGTILTISETDTLHFITIENLIPNQTYYYQVQAFDSLNNGPTTSEILTLHTAEQILFVSIPDTSIAIGSDFELPVFVSDVTDLEIRQYSLEIRYDVQNLMPLGISIDSSLTSEWSNGTFSSNDQKIVYSNSGLSDLQGSGVLFWLKFNLASAAIVGDSTELNITQANFQSSAASVETKNGKVYFAKQDSADIEVSLPDTSVLPTSQFEVALKISDPTPIEITSYSFVFSFDENILGLDKIETKNTLTKNWSPITYSGSGDSLQISHSGAEPVTGAGILLKFNFYVKEDAATGSKSDLKINDFRINNNVPVARAANGSVTVVEPANKIVGYTKNKRFPDETISGAQVYALDLENQIVSESQSDSSGYFELSDLAFEKQYRVAAIKADFSPSDTLNGIYPSYQEIELFLMAQDGEISGFVKDINQEPIEQAVLSVNNHRGFIVSVNSDQNGEFQIKYLDRRFPYQLTITKYGFDNKTMENIFIGDRDTTMTIVLDWKYGTISGLTENPQNEPISDVTISIYYQSSGQLFRTTRTDINGHFRVDSLKADSYLVVAQKSGFLTTPRQINVNLAPDEEKNIKFQLKPFQLESIQITGESFSIPNGHPTQFSFIALSDSGETIDQLEALQWQLFPELAGAVTDGIVYPDSSYLGPASLILIEPNFAISDTVNLFIYADINPNQAYQLHDDEGMELIFPEGAAPSSFQLKFDISPLQSIKGATRSHILIGKGYDFKPAEIELLKPALLILPVPADYQNRQLKIGSWDPSRAEWHILLGSHLIDSDRIEAEIESFALFALLFPSQPLGAHDIKLTPNPFSPQIDTDGDGQPGVAISFSVSSENIRQPFVTIKIYSLYGELVSALVTQRPLDKGKIYSFHWDGKTNQGRMARNGRYLIQIQMKDQKETKNYLKQVVLIK